MSELTPAQTTWRPMSPKGEIPPVPNWPVGEEQSMGLQDFCQLFFKHLRPIALCFLGSIIITGLAIALMTPTYTATTTLLVERRTPQVLVFQEVLAEAAEFNRGPTEYDFYKTQYEVLKSRTLAARIIQEQHLDTFPIVTGEGAEKGIVARTWGRAREWLMGPGSTEASAPPLPQPEGVNLPAVKTEWIDAYLGMLEVQPTRQTQLVKVAFRTPDPQLSARLANAHAEAYIRQGIELRTRANEEAESFLKDKLQELKARVEKSEGDLNRYRRDKGIVSLDQKENIVVERLTDLNRKLTEAEAERIALEGQVRLIRTGSYDALPAVINNTLIQTLTAQAARLETEYAHLTTIFKPSHPRLVEIQAHVNEAKRQLRRETQRAMDGIESAYRAAEATEKQLRAKMEQQKVATLRLKDASVDYAILAREVDTNRQLYDSTLQRMKEMGVAAELRTSNVSVLDKAEVPRRPSNPKVTKTLLLGMFLGLVGGVGVACLREYLDHTLKSAEEVERYLGLPNLAVIPDFLTLSRRGQRLWTFPSVRRRLLGASPAERDLTLANRAFSAMREAYGNLCTAILLSRAEEAPQVVLFTSARQGEGKTTAVMNTALLMAQMGSNVLVIDADLHRSLCHEVLGLENDHGLSELLTGQGQLPEIIRSTHVERLFLLRSGSPPSTPAEFLGSQKMRDILATLRERFDYILIDAPPVLPVSDAMLLSTMVDGVVLMVRAQGTPKQLVWEAHMRLRNARAGMLGAALNCADISFSRYQYDYWVYAEHKDCTERRGVDLEVSRSR